MPDKSLFSGKDVIVPDTLRIYREWALTRNFSSVRLLSTGWSHFWEGGELQARCLDPFTANHRAPAKNCMCGIYGYYELPVDYSSSCIQGTIRVSGKVLMGTKGVRAEHAEIESLRVGSWARYMSMDTFAVASETFCVDDEVLEEIRNAYSGVPVYRELHEWLLDYPPEDVSNLVGAP